MVQDQQYDRFSSSQKLQRRLASPIPRLPFKQNSQANKHCSFAASTLSTSLLPPRRLFCFLRTARCARGGQAEDWTFFFYISWNLSIEQQDEERKTFGNKERLAQVKKKWKGYCEPWKSAFECVPEDQAAWYFDLTVWDPSLAEHNWDNENGRVTLTGDAAHPTTYRRFCLAVRVSALLMPDYRTW